MDGDLIFRPLTKFVSVSLGVVGMVAAAGFMSAVAWAGAPGLATEWVEGHASRVRLLAGRSAEAALTDRGAILAGVEITLNPGWKTYWRNPGDAGGVPPEFDWSKSSNVAETKVVFPAPKRLTDKAGDTIGYKGKIVLPILVTPKDAAKPVALNLDFAFGVCRDICVPAEAQLSLDVPQGVSFGVPRAIVEALGHAPRPAEEKQPGDPELAGYEIVLTGKEPRIVLDVDFGTNPERGDVFAEAPAGLYLPMARRAETAGGANGGPVRFVVDLRETSDLEDLKGQTLRLTLVGDQGQSERQLRLE